MFDEIKKYKNNGHFFFKKGDRLADVSGQVPELPGVYYIIRLAKGRIDLVYIGKSGIMTQSDNIKEQLLKGRINKKQEGLKHQDFFDQKMVEEKIDGLDIYWFVTMDKTNNDLPGYVEGLLMQRHFEVYGKLPLWNKDF
jgi:hypothetical protein